MEGISLSLSTPPSLLLARPLSFLPLHFNNYSFQETKSPWKHKKGFDFQIRTTPK